MDKYLNFKHILGYFVSHLEWNVNKDTGFAGYATYIEPLIKNSSFYATGQGHKGDKIQNGIERWAKFSDNKICINIQSNYGRYNTRGCYLNWSGTGINILAKWKDNHIEGLEIRIFTDSPNGVNIWSEPRTAVDIHDLDLFNDSKNVNDNIIEFYNNYHNLLKNLQSMNQVQQLVNILTANHNLILTGAPGTGKTFLAKKIAESLGATEENGQCRMVQFHPSMDYTDFVEGLRPVQNTDENDSSINTFERRNGIFKDFCAEALRNFNDSRKSLSEIQSERNIEESYNQLREDIENGIVKEIPLKSEGVSMIPLISSQRNILLKAKDNSTGTHHTVSLNRIKKLSEVFKNSNDLEKIYNISKEISNVIGGCNSSAYWGLLRYLYNYYSKKIETKAEQVEQKNYVFIIDEINRGEISKIFGELFFSIDPGYRGKKGKVITQYHNLIEVGDDFENGFFVPENVYIIGTMNDIDRSVESMDFAMRRRFAWKDISVESQMYILDNEISWGINGKPDEETLKELKNRMTHLNQAIIDKYKFKEDKIHNNEKIGLTKSFQIGPAYFLKYNLYNNFDDLWKYHIEGLLYEYLRGVPNIDEKLGRLLEAYKDKSAIENN